MRRDAAGFPPSRSPPADDGPTVRAAGADDADVIAAMIAALSAEDGADPPEFTQDHFLCHGLGPGRLFDTLVADLDGHPAGMAIVTRGYDSQSASGGIILEDLYVEPLARRRGVGTALIAACARLARNEGRHWVAWQVRRSNVRAQIFYRALGAAAETVDTMALAGEAFDRMADRV